MEQNVTLDILGALIGFAAIMLLLSLIVTILVQTAIHFWGLRGRNLRHFLDTLFRRALSGKPDELKKRLLDHVCTLGGYWKGERTASGSNSPSRSLSGILVGKQITWISRDDLARLLFEFADHAQKPSDTETQERTSPALDEEDIVCILDWFPRIEASMSARFKTYSLWLSYSLGLLVAFMFQVSAPHLMARLSSDEAFRERAVNVAESIDEELVKSSVYAATEQALRRLLEAYPEHAGAIDQVSGQGDTIFEPYNELQIALGDDPSRNAILDTFLNLLNAEFNQEINRASERLGSITGKLALLDIQPWGQGREFYKHWQNWTGILLTWILISLGAPFWYNTLRKLISLRDSVKGQLEDEQKAAAKMAAKTRTVPAADPAASGTPLNESARRLQNRLEAAYQSVEEGSTGFQKAAETQPSQKATSKKTTASKKSSPKSKAASKRRRKPRK